VLRCRALGLLILALVIGATIPGLSGPAKVQEGNYGLDTVGSAGSGSNVCRNWPGDPVLQLGWLPQLQEEALDAAFHTFARGLGASAILVRLALDSFDADPDDTLSMAGLPGDRVEAEQGIQEPPPPHPQDAAGLGGLDFAPAGEVIDGGYQVDGDVGGNTTGAELFWLISHYTAGANYGGTSYPYGSATASGIPAQPGVVACGSGYLGKVVTIAGWDMLCADTGNPQFVYDGVADIWCEGESWGPTDPQYAGEWWYGLPCPAPCEWQDEAGRCFARAEVVR